MSEHAAVSTAWRVRRWASMATHVSASRATSIVGLCRTKIVGLLFAAVAAGLCGQFVHPHGYVVLLAILAVLVLGVAWPWVCIRSVSVVIAFDRARCREDEPAVVRIAFRNRWPIPVWGARVEGLELEPGGASLPSLNIAAWERGELRQTFIPRRRGEYPQGTPRLRCGFPFGLWHPGKAVAVEQPLLVWPAVVRVAPLRDAGGHPDPDGATAVNALVSCGEFAGVRQFRRGDGLRQVHWGQTARHDRLIVRDTHAVVRPRVRIVLEAEPDRFRDLGPGGPREWAIRVAASLCIGWLDQGASVGMVVGDRSFAVSRSTAKHRTRVMDSLARLDSKPKPRRSAPTISSDVLTVVITSRQQRDEAPPPNCPLERERRIIFPAEWPDPHESASTSAASWPSCWIGIRSAAEVESRLCLR